MATFSAPRPCQDGVSECGCGELMAREYDSAIDQSLTYFSTCRGEDLRNLAVGDTFELCQAGYRDRKLYYDTWLVFY